MDSILADAIRDHRILVFDYHNFQRRVEPHTYGISIDSGEEMLSGFQTAGGSISGGIPDWRLFRVVEMANLQILDDVFTATRPGYNPNDSRMRIIYAKA